MVKPTAAVLVSMDPVSPKASVLFEELTSVADVKYIFATGLIDTHKKYNFRKKRGKYIRILHGDFSGFREGIEKSIKRKSAGCKLKNSPWPREGYSIDHLRDLSGACVVKTELIKASEYWYVLDDSVIDSLKSLDFAILLSFNALLTGDALSATKWGIFSFHPADTFRYRGRPSCFFEFINGECEYAITLQVLNEHIDGGAVLSQRFLSADTVLDIHDARICLEHLQPSMITEAVKKLTFSSTADSLNPLNNIKCPDLRKSRLHKQSDADRLMPTLKYLTRVILKRYNFRNKAL